MSQNVDVATLQINVNGAEASRGVRQYTQSVEEAERTTQRFTRTERAARDEMERVERTTRTGAREMDRYERAVIEAELATRRMAHAEREAYREADRMAQAQRRATEEARRLAAEQRSVAVALRTINAGIALFVGSRFVRGAIEMADSAKSLEGRLRLVTGSAEELRAVQAALADSAMRTRTSYEDNVVLFSRVARSTEDLNKSQAELLRFTELVQMAIKSGNATNAEARNGVIQFTQAIAGGVVRAEELNSMLEQTPGLALAIAAGLGVTQGELRRMVVEGRLSSRELFDAIETAEAKIRDDFAKAPELVSEAFTAMKDSVLRAVAEMDRGMDGSSKIATTLRRFGIMLDAITASSQRTRDTMDRMGTGTVAPSFAAVPPGLEGPSAHGRIVADALAAIDRIAKAESEARDERRADWERSRRYAAEKAKWEEEELLRLGRIELAARKAMLARMAPGLGAIGGITVGDGVGPLTPAGFGGGIYRLPTGFTGTSVANPTSYDPKASAEARARAMMEADEHIARHFAENMQRAVGDVFADFVRTGRVSVRDVFAGLGSIGADLFGQAFSKAVMPKFDSLSTGQQMGVGLGIGLVATAITDMIDGSRQFRAEMRAAARAMQQWNLSVDDWIMASRMWDASPEERARYEIGQKASGFARDAWNIYRDAPGDYMGGLTGDPERDRAVIQRRLAAAGGRWDRLSGPGQTPADALRRYFEALQKVTEATELATEAAEEQARAATRAAAAERAASYARTIEALQGFGRDLRASNLSIYSPQQQGADARARYEELYLAAMQGDQSAADKIPAAARAYLESQRALYASGSRYTAEFQRVERETANVERRFEAERSLQQQIADGTLETANGISRIDDTLTRHEPYLEASVSALQANGETTVRLLAAVETMSRDMARRLEAVEHAVLQVAA